VYRTGFASTKGGCAAAAGAYGPAMASHRPLAGFLAVGCIVLAPLGEALVLTHSADVLGLVLLACGAAAGVAGWVALGMPRTRADIRA
jgi:hypothetical protein